MIFLVIAGCWYAGGVLGTVISWWVAPRFGLDFGVRRWALRRCWAWPWLTWLTLRHRFPSPPLGVAQRLADGSRLPVPVFFAGREHGVNIWEVPADPTIVGLDADVLPAGAALRFVVPYQSG